MSTITWPQFFGRLLLVGIMWGIIAYSMALIQVKGDTWYAEEAPPNAPLLDISDSNEHEVKVKTADLVLSINVAYFFFFILIAGGRTARRIIYLRAILLLALMYILRMSTIGLTMLPPRDPDCSLKVAKETSDYFYHAITNLYGEYTCTDQVFSGHTTTMALCALLADTYIRRDHEISPFIRSLSVLGVLISYTLAIVGSALVSLSRMHYTVDIVLAWILASFMVQWYHYILYISRNLTINMNFGLGLLPWWSFVSAAIPLIDKIFCCPAGDAVHVQDPAPEP